MCQENSRIRMTELVADFFTVITRTMCHETIYDIILLVLFNEF